MEFKRKRFRLTELPGVSSGGFSLIELLAVILIIGILVAASGAYYQGSIVGLRIATDGNQIESMFSLAQQTASSEGRNVEVRFYKFKDEQDVGDERFRSIVLLRYYQAGESSPAGSGSGTLTAPLAVLMGEAHTLSPGIVMTEDAGMSSLLSGSPSPGASVETMVVTKEGLEKWEYPASASFKSFIIRPEGTSLDPKGKWFVTVVSDRDEEGGASKAKNFYCVQIDPGTGRVTSYRP